MTGYPVDQEVTHQDQTNLQKENVEFFTEKETKDTNETVNVLEMLENELTVSTEKPAQLTPEEKVDAEEKKRKLVQNLTKTIQTIRSTHNLFGESILGQSLFPLSENDLLLDIQEVSDEKDLLIYFGSNNNIQLSLINQMGLDNDYHVLLNDSSPNEPALQINVSQKIIKQHLSKKKTSTSKKENNTGSVDSSGSGSSDDGGDDGFFDNHDQLVENLLDYLDSTLGKIELEFINADNEIPCEVLYSCFSDFYKLLSVLSLIHYPGCKGIEEDLILPFMVRPVSSELKIALSNLSLRLSNVLTALKDATGNA